MNIFKRFQRWTYSILVLKDRRFAVKCKRINEFSFILDFKINLINDLNLKLDKLEEMIFYIYELMYLKIKKYFNKNY